MEIKHTSRGFLIGYFKDANGHECRIQESSAIREEGLIRLGATEVKVELMTSNGWKTLDIGSLPDVKGYVANQLMHLTQTQVKELLPLLSHFAEHGVLPPNEVYNEK